MKKKSELKRQAILEVATEVFREFGFKKTLMSEICARVGGSKATLYNHFPSKEELFFEVMAASTEAEFQAVHQALSGSGDDIDNALRHFGEKLLAFLYSPEVKAQRYLAISQSGRTELGRFVYERGVMRSQTLVSEFLKAAMAAGKLKKADPMIATQHLHCLLESELLDAFLFQQLGPVSAEAIQAMTNRAIDVFMAAYGPQQTVT